MSLNITEIFSKDYLIEYIHRNKILIVVSALLFILSVIVGIVASDSIKQVMIEILKQMVEQFPANPTVADEAFLLFSNNIRANIIILLGGFFFSILSILIIILNGIVIGFTSTMIPPLVFVVGIIPHGIFELPATALSLVGALLITKLEIKVIRLLLSGDFRKKAFELGFIVKDILLTFILTLVLLVIAAVIEAGVTPILLSMVV